MLEPHDVVAVDIVSSARVVVFAYGAGSFARGASRQAWITSRLALSRVSAQVRGAHIAFLDDAYLSAAGTGGQSVCDLARGRRICFCSLLAENCVLVRAVVGVE